MLIKIVIPLFLILCLVTTVASAQTPSRITNPFYQSTQSYVQQYHNPQARAAQPAPTNQPLSPQDWQIRPQLQLQPLTQRHVQTLINANQTAPKEQTALEKMYAGRIVDELNQFGYDMFGANTNTARQNTHQAAPFSNALPPMGAVQDDFVLSSGDQLEIMFTGQKTERAIYTISSQGTLLVPDLAPIPAAGRTIAQIRTTIQSAAGTLYNTQAYISLASIHQIGVLVIGHVGTPGRQNLTVFHSVIDALMQAGGIHKTGSLRQIKLIRDGRSTVIDLYGLLIHGATNMDLRLKDGDRIIVPSIGPTLAISGEVKRPGIYETRQIITGMMHKPEDKAQKLSLNEMLELSGGVLSPGDNRFLHLGISKAGTEKVDDITKPFQRIFGDGSILVVSKGEQRREGTVELIGHTRKPGIHALSKNKTLSALIKSENILGADIYPLIGVIKRWNSKQLSHEHISFPLKLVLSGEFDQRLQESDTIIFFSNKQIKTLQNQTTGINTSHIQNVSYGSIDPEIEDNNIIDPVLTSFLTERAAFIRGAVRNQGAYPVASGTTLDNLLAAAGGMALEANAANIEITSKLQGKGLQTDGRSGTRRLHINLRETPASNVPIGPGDSIRINQKFKKIEDKSVLIMGEVVNPGGYDLIPGDKLSDLLSRAGGLTNQAYADGAIFSRATERKAEESRFKAQARMLKQAMAAAMEKDDKKINAAQIAEARALAKELEMAEGVGRITVTASPAILKVKPELDILLEEGDRLFIPKRSLTVRVSGEVLSSAALQFRDDKKSLDYIHEAGGFTFHADKERTFVLYPDGSAQPLQVSSWNYNPVMIPPGSTIIVPRDPEPFDFIESAKDISQILSNLAITAIFIDDVRDDD